MPGPLRDLTLFAGFNNLGSGTPIATISLPGFMTPVFGPVHTTISGGAYEGALGITGDFFKLSSNVLSDAANPANNFFNSNIARLGRNVFTRAPNDINNLGFDANLPGASGILPNGATSTTVTLGTNGDA